jgi:dephospho-CoA kinase
MTAPRPILRVGLTGGIASGKSTVAGMFADLGAFVVDADELAHLAIAPGGAAHDAVVARFGREVLDADGRIDRPRLGRLVFSDPAARNALNAIVHPAVRAEAERRIAVHAEKSRSPISIFDAALLVETGAYRDFHRLIVTRCGPETQLRRLTERDRMPREEAVARIDAQAPLERKLAVAHYVVDTEAPIEKTRDQTSRVFSSLLADYDELFGD